MYEIFDPRDGVPVLTVRWRWLARLITWNKLHANWDFAHPGEGW